MWKKVLLARLITPGVGFFLDKGYIMKIFQCKQEPAAAVHLLNQFIPLQLPFVIYMYIPLDLGLVIIIISLLSPLPSV